MDGSEVEQCGNGVRCVTWMLARDAGGQTVFRLESAAGPVEARMLPDGRVTVNMGAPVFEPELIPFEATEAEKQYAIDLDGKTVTAAVLSMGNPHCVIEVADVAAADVGTLGAHLESHDRFPARTNVGFMHIVDRGTIDLRVFERGVGETLACGTGACAATVAAHRRGRPAYLAARDRARTTATRAMFDNLLDYLRKHTVIVERFGRYPHRNAILGRTSTEEERAFLTQPGSSF